MPISPSILLPIVTAFVCLLVPLSRRRKSLRFLQGPPTSSWILGHEYHLENQPEESVAWFQNHGSAFRCAGFCGEDILMVSDAEALHHILETGGYRYLKPQAEQRFIEHGCGRGLGWAEGAVHRRHKKALAPAFSDARLQTHLPVFQMYTDKLALRWRRQLADSSVIDVSSGLSKALLDILGQTSFNFQFGSLDDRTSLLSESLQNISQLPSRAGTFMRELKQVLPDSFVELLESIYVSEEEARLRMYAHATKETAIELSRWNDVKSKKPTQGKPSQMHSKEVEERNDMLNLLLRLKEVGDPRRQLDDLEVLSQVSNMLLAGHAVTASTLTWILSELSRNPLDQERIREEIHAIRGKGDGTMLLSDYESMTYLNACVKEGLRLHPGVQFITRVADMDDVVPLAQPIASVSGEILQKIPVTKGQRLKIGIAAYNQSSSIWGPDSDQWNPSRHLDGSESKKHVMSFGYGVRACIGERFAMIELQAILVGLLAQFEFKTPPEGWLEKDVKTTREGLSTPLVVKVL